MSAILPRHPGAMGGRSCLVRADSRLYLIPLHMLVEWIDLPAAGGALPDLPLIRLAEPAGAARPARAVVVVCCGRRRAGLLVDALLGESPGAMAPPCPLCRRLRGIAGFVVLDSGEVAPVLDLPALLDGGGLNSF